MSEREAVATSTTGEGTGRSPGPELEPAASRVETLDNGATISLDGDNAGRPPRRHKHALAGTLVAGPGLTLDT